MIKNHIVTCGTSQIEKSKLRLIGQAENEIDNLFVALKEWTPNTILDHELEYSLNRIADRLISMVDLLPGRIGTDDNPFGAEFSTLYMIMDQYHAGDRKTFFILSSDTGKGVFCARILQALLMKHYGVDFGDINILVVPGLKEDPHSQNEIENLMHNLLDKVSDSLLNNSGGMVDNLIVMTGGFKSIIPCLTLVATLFGLGMVYQFEHSQYLQRLMPMINFNEKITRQKWISNWNDVMRGGKVGETSWMYQLIKIRNDRKDEVFWS